jgi:HSP20 family protein
MNEMLVPSLAPFAAFRRRMDRFFDEFARDFPSPGGLSTEFLPGAELSESKDALSLRLELPGIEEKDVKISAEDRTITVSGEKRQSSEAGNGGRFESEFSYGAFSRTFATPFPVDADKVDARFANGVLTITIPKPADYAGRQRQISIKH